MKKIITVLLICLFAYSVFAAETELAPSNGKYSYTKVNAYNGIGINSVKTEIYNDDENTETFKGSVFPKAFNLRDDMGWIYPAKNMDPYYNSSWATSAADVISLSEASKTGINTLEVSALNMITKNPYGNLLETGGTVFETMAYLYKALGPIEEKDDPWIFPYVSPETQPKRVGDVDSVQIISANKLGLSSKEINTIKNEIYNNNHALQVKFYYNEIFLHRYFSYFCQEIPAGESPNLYAAIVGWDDNYDKGYFDNLPISSGAFLVKCSFGPEWTAAEQGYIWISYEDVSLSDVVYYNYNSLSDVNYETVMTYQKGCGMTSAITEYSKGSVFFNPDNAGEITGFRLYFIKDIMCNIEVYINNESVGYSIDYKPDYPGYATVMLDNYDQSPIRYNKGDEIQVLIDYDPRSSSSIIDGIPIPIESEYNGLTPDFYPNTSYVADYKNRWVDVSKTGNIGISLLTDKVYDVISIEVDPDEMTLSPNAIAKIKATVYPKEAKDKRLVWKSSNTSVAEVNNGVVKAKKFGKALITVSSVQNPKITASVKVTVKDQTIHVTKVEISGSNSVNVGKTLQLDTVITPTDATVKDVIWESSDESIAEVNSDGCVYGKSAGKVLIKATSIDNPKAYDIKKISVTKIPVESVNILGADTKVNVGESISFDAIVTPSDATVKDVKWASSNKKIATVDSNGNVFGKAAGKVLIKASSVDNAKIYDIKEITVIEILVNKIIIPESLVLKEGTQEKIIAKVLPENAKNKEVKYKLSSTKYATVSADGTVTAKKFSESAKTVNVKLRVYSAVNSKVYSDCNITIVHGVKDINVPERIDVDRGSDYSVKTSIIPSTAYNKTLLWKSSNKTIATVSDDGIIKAKKVGKCYIYVKSADNPSIVKTIKLNVTEPVAKIELPSSLSVKRNTKFKIDYKILPENADNKNVIWTSSNPNIIKVSDSKKGNLSSGNNKGISKITVKSVANPDVYAVCTVKVQ